jgi:hypothetical protein
VEVHVRLLAYLNIALGYFGLFGILLVVALGGGPRGMMSLGAEVGTTTPMGLVATGLSVFWLVIAYPCIRAGHGLLKLSPSAQTFTIILSIVNLINIPAGTLVGIYGLWVLNAPETAPLFEQRRGETQRRR